MNRSKLPLGTFVNMATVVIGGIIGLSISKTFSPELELIISQAIGLGVLVLGFQMTLKLPESYLLVFILSLILGGVTGELIHLDRLLYNSAELLKTLFSSTDNSFAEGMTTAFILFCIGSLTILGALEEGLQGKRNLLFVKSGLDGISAIIFAAKFGVGVIFSIFPMLIFQGGITIIATFLKNGIKEVRLKLISAVGGALIIAIGLNVLEISSINIENLLPALIFLFPLSILWERFGPKL
ncbi:MAG: DUF554 domain-containing protein [Saprospiraceae bacterium]|nr:DUF554 domain-containing protein [Saprospiraceae bacterium]